MGRNTLLEQSQIRKTHDLDIASREEKLMIRNKELERREMLRQIAEERSAGLEGNAFSDLIKAQELRELREIRERRDSDA